MLALPPHKPTVIEEYFKWQAIYNDAWLRLVDVISKMQPTTEYQKPKGSEDWVTVNEFGAINKHRGW